MKLFFQNVVILSITTFIMLLICEGVLRFYYSSGTNSIKLDTVLGWDVVHDYQHTALKMDLAKKPYSCTYTIDKNGFRQYGHVNTTKPKLLFVGDSFTQAEDATDDSTYFSVLSRTLDAELFAYGVGGYGSLQEMMILTKYIAQIKPDLVIIQFTSNDFINNCYNLEYRSIQNSGTIRPYLTPQNTITYRLPKNHPTLRKFANTYSRLLYFVINQLDKYYSKPDTFTPADYAESVQVTTLTYQQISAICHQQHAVLTSFMVDGVNSLEATFYHSSMQKLGIAILADVPSAIEQAEKAGINCKAADGGHWNHTAHRICGLLLAEKLSAKASPVLVTHKTE